MSQIHEEECPTLDTLLKASITKQIIKQQNKMSKKEFYEAPIWGVRTVTVARQYLQITSPTGISDIDGDDVNDDSDGWGQN